MLLSLSGLRPWCWLEHLGTGDLTDLAVKLKVLRGHALDRKVPFCMFPNPPWRNKILDVTRIGGHFIQGLANVATYSFAHDFRNRSAGQRQNFRAYLCISGVA